MKIKFWGGRGSIPSGSPETARVGGNTTCIEIRCGDADALVYDAQYTEDEYYGLNGQFPRKGWGHSTMREGIKIAEAGRWKSWFCFITTLLTMIILSSKLKRNPANFFQKA